MQSNQKSTIVTPASRIPTTRTTLTTIATISTVVLILVVVAIGIVSRNGRQVVLCG